VQRYNGDLANGYGNLVSRVVNMVHKYFGGVVPEAGAETDAEAVCALPPKGHRRIRAGVRRAEFF
jgi:methionyl-tRNA synthetase